MNFREGHWLFLFQSESHVGEVVGTANIHTISAARTTEMPSLSIFLQFLCSLIHIYCHSVVIHHSRAHYVWVQIFRFHKFT